LKKKKKKKTPTRASPFENKKGNKKLTDNKKKLTKSDFFIYKPHTPLSLLSLRVKDPKNYKHEESIYIHI
jgi:hypothetical protein